MTFRQASAPAPTESSPMISWLLGLGLVALDALWLGAWLRWLAASGRPGLNPPGFLVTAAIGATALAVTRLVLGSRLRMGPARGVALLAGATAVLVAARVTLYPFEPAREGLLATRYIGDLAGLGTSTASARLLLVAAAFLWWRGARFARQRLRPVHARRSAATALLALALVAVLVVLGHPVDLAPWIAGAMACCLVVLALARLQEAGSGYGGTASGFGGVWVTALVGAIGAVALVAAVLVPVLSLEAARALVDSVAPLPDVVYQLVAVLVLKSVELAFGFIELLYGQLLQAFGPPNELPPREVPELLQPIEALSDGEGWVAPRWLLAALRLATPAAGLLLLAILLARAMKRVDERGAEEHYVERESALSLGRIGDDLASVLATAASNAAAAIGRFRNRPQGVRALYRRLLVVMDERGVGRWPSQTPYEYQSRLIQRLPGSAEDLRYLTRAYVAARYAERAPEAPALAALTEAWHRIRERVEDRERLG